MFPQVQVMQVELVRFNNEKKIITNNFDSLYSKTKNSTALVHLVGIGHQNTTLDFEEVNVKSAVERTKRV